MSTEVVINKVSDPAAVALVTEDATTLTESPELTTHGLVKVTIVDTPPVAEDTAHVLEVVVSVTAYWVAELENDVPEAPASVIVEPLPNAPADEVLKFAV